jgi:predicted CXXCH cytochrome family protein
MSWNIDQQSSGRRRFASLVATVAVALAGVAISLPASAQMSAVKPTGISQTKHNLGASGTGKNRLAAGQSTEVCVFCHTPHAANVATGPLWNRAATTQTIVPYTSASLTGGTRSGATGTAEAPGAISLACLSCHDGVQAMNSVINAPGSGGYTAGGGTFGTLNVATEGVIAGVAAIGGDLTNDHPIGVRYAGGALAANQVVGGYNEFQTATINSTAAFWVDTQVAGTSVTGRQKTDMWLYPRDATPTTAFVECASCHDPHTQNTTFLRIPNDYSSVCLSCHIK